MFIARLSFASDAITVRRQEFIAAYDEDLHNIISVLTDACELLEEAGARFEVSGPDPLRWRTDAGIDLCIVLEQLPDIISWLLQPGDEPCSLEFYEQGTDLLVEFSAVEGSVLVKYKTFRTPVTLIGSELEDRAGLLAMFLTLADTFISAIRASAPRLAEHPWFVEWAQSLVFKDRAKLP